jgi:hypothetical protein
LGIWTPWPSIQKEPEDSVFMHICQGFIQRLKSKRAVKETTTIDHQFFEVFFQTPGTGDSLIFKILKKKKP